MSLQLIIGGSGMGKSTWLYNQVIAGAMKNKENNYIVLVPEQYTMETQRKLVAMHPAHVLLNIDVLSFERLSFRILEEVGAQTGKMLDDTGKNLIIRKVMEERKKELSVLSGGMNRMGFVSQVKSAVSELMQYNVNPERAKTLGEEIEEPQLRAKLKDIGVIYQAFRSYIENHYLTTEELFSYVSRRVPESRKMKDSVIVLDGFTGFTPVQYQLLYALFSQVKKLAVTIPVDAQEKYNVQDGMENLFYLGKETIARLHEMADRLGGHTEPPVLLADVKKSRFAQNPALYFLGKHLFDYQGAVYREKTDALVCIDAPGPREEFHWVAGEILRLTRFEGLRYRDIAVIAGNVADYGEYAEKTFAQNNIPVFMDYKRELLGNVLVELIRSVLGIFIDNYSYDSLMRCLKTGLFPVGERETDLLDNYCLATGVRGAKAWKNPFTRKYRNIKMTSAQLEELNDSRKKIMDWLMPLEEALKQKEGTAGTMTAALRAFLSRLEAHSRMEQLAETAENQGERDRASVFRQIGGKIEELFLQIEELLGDEKVSLREYARILDAGFEDMKIGIIPPGADYVLVGDMERTRIDNKKVLFCVGVNEGKVPGVFAAKSLFTNSDKTVLQGHGVSLSPDDREKTFIQRLYLYMNFTKPSQRLYLSYVHRDWNGQAQSRSYLIGSLQKMFPMAPRIHIQEGEESPWIALPGAEFLWSPGKQEQSLSIQTAKKLYGEEIRASVTRVERYAACAFSHFAAYGLSLAQREEFRLEAKDMGTVLHGVLEEVSRRLKEEKRDFSHVGEAERKALVQEAMQEVLGQCEDAVFKDSSRNQFLTQRLEEIAQRSVWALGQQLSRGEFVPYAFELPFSIETGEHAAYVGKIDRVDICEDGDNLYVKIVDYKSGGETFDWTKVYHGLKLQLLTYMQAAQCRLKESFPHKNIIPAAALYYHMDNPIVAGLPQEEGDGAFWQVLEELKPDGLISCDEEIVKKMDGAVFESGGRSLVIPAVVEPRSKTLKISGNTVSTRQFEGLEEHVSKALQRQSAESMEGCIAVNPVEESRKSSCTYCPYDDVCGFCREIDGAKIRRFPKLSPEEVWGKISLEEAGEKEIQERKAQEQETRKKEAQDEKAMDAATK